MATLIDHKRDGEIRLTYRGGTLLVEETHHYLILADYKTEPYTTIATASGCPFPGVSTSAGGIAICKSFVGRPRERNPLYWDFVAEFSSEVPEGNDTNDPTVDPTTWIPEYRSKFERIQETVATDKNGDAVANSTGQPYETGLTINRTIPCWEFLQFESASVTDETLADRNETVNSGTFKGRSAKTLLCVVLDSEIGRYYGQRRRLTKYQLKWNSKKWTHKRQDVGTVYKSGSDLLPYLDSDGVSVILGALDGAGGKQTVGDPPAVNEFDIYEPIDFYTFLRV